MARPWKHATYIVEKAPLYDRWNRRWHDLTARLDAFRPTPHGASGCDAVMLSVLSDGVSTAELLRNGAACAERWNIDPVTLSQLMAVRTWDVKTIGYWLGLPERRVRRILKDGDIAIPKEALVGAVVPLVVPTVESRRARAWILSVAEIIGATT